jgi:amino acid adenylation domain-containing protein
MAGTGQFSDAKKRLLERFLRGEAARQNWEAPLEQRQPGDPIPLAPSQHQVWLHAQMAPGTPLYNEPITLHYRGTLDRAVLERSFHEILRRHEIWRTTFASVDGQVVQAVHADLTVAIPLTDLTGLPEREREREALRIATAEARRPFDLSVGPLLRARLIKFADDYHRIYITLHHIIFDGVAIYRVLLSEMAAVYEAFSKGLPSPLAEPRYQYADYAIWEKRLLDNDSAARQMDYWRGNLAGELPALQLPTDRPHPPAPSYRGGMETFSLTGEMTEALRHAAKTEGVTLYMLVLTAFKALLYRYTGQEDILIGGATDGRKRPEFDRLLGFFLHTLALRSRPKGDLTFREYLGQVKDTVLGALGASDVPFDQLVREVNPRRDPSRHPLFQVLFSIEPPPPPPDPHWDLTQMDVHNGASKIDLYLELDERPEGMIGRFLYNSDIFDVSTVRRMIGHWVTLLQGVLENPAATLAELPLLTAEERRLTAEWNNTPRPIPHTTISQMFEDRAAQNPHAMAVQCNGAWLTYRELNQEANRLARRLREAGAGPETLVGLCMERSCDMVVALLAILKAGAAYLPLDPALPAERFRMIVEDARAPILVTERWRAAKVPTSGATLVFPDDVPDTNGNLEAHAGPENLAYVLYTSGSTGRPKGVEIPHSAVVNFLESMRREPGFTAADTLLAVTTLSFDIAALEIFLPLIAGGRLAIASREDARDPARLAELIREIAPSVMQATPATWRAVIEAGWAGDPRLKILCGGEAMPRDLAQHLLPRCSELWNMYGPTETTIWSAIQRVESGAGPVPIGRPIDNTQIYILDRGRNTVPPGVVGDLYIGGAGVARGYLGREELTRDRFTETDPGRLYRTGDLARWRVDGTLEFLGRSDNQLKIRGFRIEPEEIEAALLEHPEVLGAAVRAWPDASGHFGLTAYVVSPTRPSIRAFLDKKLPEHMVPPRVIWLEALPLTPNGKVDRNRLPQPDPEEHRTLSPAPSSEMERKLAAVWESVLDRKSIGIRDDFFDLGGHSLLVAKLLSRVEQAFGVRLPMASLFEAPTLQEFAVLLRNSAMPASIPARTVTIRGNASEHPLVWVYPGAEMQETIKHLRVPFTGVALTPQDEATLPQDFSLEQIAVHLAREVRAAQPEGPYSIGGWCSGGILAYEVAVQLRRQGCRVDTLILVDSLNLAAYLAMPAWRRRASKIEYHLKRIAALRRGGVLNYLRGRAAWALERFGPKSGEILRSYEERFSQATGKYIPPPYSGRVLALRPEQMPTYRDPLLHWRNAATGELQIRTLRGNHVTMFTDGAADMAAAIEAALAAPESHREIGVPKLEASVLSKYA